MVSTSNDRVPPDPSASRNVRAASGSAGDHRVGKSASHWTENLADRVEQILGHAAALQDEPHEGKERDAEQRVVRHHPPEPFRERLDELRAEETEVDAKDGVADAHRRKRE